MFFWHLQNGWQVSHPLLLIRVTLCIRARTNTIPVPLTCSLLVPEVNLHSTFMITCLTNLRHSTSYLNANRMRSVHKRSLKFSIPTSTERVSPAASEWSLHFNTATVSSWSYFRIFKGPNSMVLFLLTSPHNSSIKRPFQYLNTLPFFDNDLN